MVTEQEGTLLVRKLTDSKLSGRKFCRENGIDSNFKTAKGVPTLIEKSLASPSIIDLIGYSTARHIGIYQTD